MDIRNFQTFTTIYETGSINKAARQLGYAQSNITTKLKHIEDEYGIRLFTRSSRGVAPTAEGERFYQFACQAQDLDRRFRQSLPTAPRSAAMTESLFNYLVGHRKALSPDLYEFDVMAPSQLDRSVYMNHDVVAGYCVPSRVPTGQIRKGVIPSHLYTIAGSDDEAIYVSADTSCAYRLKTLEVFQTTVASPRIHVIDSLMGIISVVKSRGGSAILADYLAEQSGLVRADSSEYSIHYQLWSRQ